MYEIRVTDEFGRAIFSCAQFKKGEIITDCEVLVLSVGDTEAVLKTDLFFYVFLYDRQDGRECVVLGDGSMFNHSCPANVSYNLVEYGGRKVMRFVATRDIEIGEHLCIDYTADRYEDPARFVDRNLYEKLA